MKRYLNRLFSFTLVVSVLISAFLCCPISVYATHGGGGSSNHGTLTDEEKNQKLQEFIDNGEAYLIWLLSELGACVNGDTSQALLNYDSLKAYWNEDHLSFDDSDNFVVDQELVNAVKQTLGQYQQETESYYIAFTYPMNRLDFSVFGNQKNVYDTVNNLLKDSESGFIKVALYRYGANTYIYFSEFEDFTDTGFIKYQSNNLAAAYRYSTLKNSAETKYAVILTPDDPAIETIAELKEKAHQTREYYNYNQSDVYIHRVCDETMKQADTSTALWSGNTIAANLHIVSPTRRSIRVFNSFDDLADYSIGNRKVYFTSGYYDYVPSDITVSLDEMTETVGRLEDVYDQLLDQIDNNTEESEIEDLLQQILDEMKNGGGDDDNNGDDNKDDGNNGGSNYDDSGLLSLLSGYFEQVLAYLKSISGTISEGFSSIKGKLDNVSDKLSGGTDASTDLGSVEDLLQQILDKIDGSVDISTIEDLLHQILDKADDFTDKSMVEDLLQQVLDKIDESTDKSTVEDLLQQILEELKNSNNAPEHWYDDILDYLDRILSQLKSIKRWAVIDTVIDGVDAIADWFDLIHDILSDADNGMESAVSTLSSAVSDAVGLMTKKFPFSIPWDLFFFISFFSAEPEVPCFEVPFCLPYYDFEYVFVVDFEDYQWLSNVIRPILAMSYALGLLMRTPSILSIGKED